MDVNVTFHSDLHNHPTSSLTTPHIALLIQKWPLWFNHAMHFVWKWLMVFVQSRISSLPHERTQTHAHTHTRTHAVCVHTYCIQVLYIIETCIRISYPLSIFGSIICSWWDPIVHVPKFSKILQGLSILLPASLNSSRRWFVITILAWWGVVSTRKRCLWNGRNAFYRMSLHHAAFTCASEVNKWWICTSVKRSHTCAHHKMAATCNHHKQGVVLLGSLPQSDIRAVLEDDMLTILGQVQIPLPLCPPSAQSVVYWPETYEHGSHQSHVMCC